MAAVLIGLSVLGAGAWLAMDQGWRMAVLWGLGAALGVALLHAAFGFTAAFRRFLTESRGAGLRAQMVLLGLTCIAFLPAIESGALLGQPVRGFVFPTGLALLVGAFLFGIGMQLGGGCGSGTLYAVGAGRARMLITLAAFVGGATLAAGAADLWQAWPSAGPISLPEALGIWSTLALSLCVFALVFIISIIVERRRYGDIERLPWRGGNWLRGPWPLLWGAVALALLNIATLIVAGRPWAITAAFPLWGSQLMAALGWAEPAFWTYWDDPTRTEALLRRLDRDRVTVMDVGLIAGASFAAALSRNGRERRLPNLGEVAASGMGGLLLGIGAVLASGCNISAYVGGIASGSLHGWIWIFPALLGNALGLKLRPAFGLGKA